ncbi:TRAP transporter substrate-binding protein DctP [Microbaculum sp. FT89]|uniref:TRAP transporter substrate-binding protein DctP n=1 Tax=Microbaculum sp. FT89 TaxID=3447298 RepID=UPI003F537CF2
MKLHIMALTACLAYTAATANAQEYPDLDLRLAHPLPETWPGVEWDKWWAEQVTERSGGKIKIEIFWAGQIGGITEIKSLVSSGAIDLGVFAQAVHAEEIPLTASSAGLLNRVSANPATANTLAGKMYSSEPVQEELAANGLQILKWTVPSPYTLQCNKAINTTADLRGLKVRAVGGAYVPIWMESYGMVPTMVQAPEVREGLLRGTLDCNFGPIEMATFANLEDSAPYWSDINTGSFTTFQLYANRNSWEAWPESVRTLMTDVAQEAMERDQDALEQVSQKAVDDYTAAGGKLIELSDMDAFEAASPDMIAVWEERMTATGHGDAVGQLIGFQREAAQSFDRD